MGECMSSREFLNHWWNLPFLVMLGLVAAYFGLQTLGIFEGGADHEADVPAEHDADVEADHDLDHDIDGAGLAGWFGLGRVPMMVIWLRLFIFMGFGGLFFNRVLFVKSGGHYPWWYFPISTLSSLAVGAAATRASARLVSKLVDVGGRGATARRERPGSIGVVASARVDEGFGEVRVRDGRGNALIVHARVESRAAHPRQGEQVVLVDYDEKSGPYTVAPINAGG